MSLIVSRLKSPLYIFYLFFLFLLFDFSILKVFHSRFSQNAYQNHLYKKPMPYVGFSGYPDTLGHNKYGYIGPDLSNSTDKDFIIAFFGGSTGYNGDPAIPKLIELELKKNNFNGSDVFISNFSVIASNHNQHLHMIIESLMLKNIDLVIFYGGYNEIIQTAAYDSRPGYPYNFFYINEYPTWKKLIIENSFIAQKFFKPKYIPKKKDEIPFSKSWQKKIKNNYLTTIKKAKKITSALNSNVIDSTVFFAFYQPYQFELTGPELHEQIIKDISDFNYIFDVSNTYDTINPSFIDVVHVNQKSKQIMSKIIAKKIIENIIIE